MDISQIPHQRSICPKVSTIWITAGPKSTIKRLGKMKKTKGKSILMGAFMAASSADGLTATLYDGMRAQEVVEAAARSYAERKWVKLPLA